MKISALLLLVPAACAARWNHDPPLTTNLVVDSTKVPGESPIEFCNSDRDDDILQIEKIDIAPNPPVAGKSVRISALGSFKADVAKGAYVKLTVKYGLIQLISTTADLCEQAGNLDLSCPLKKGKLDIVKSVDLPAAIPPGTYTATADIYSNDDEPITCLKATINFPRPSFAQKKLDV